MRRYWRVESLAQRPGFEELRGAAHSLNIRHENVRGASLQHAQNPAMSVNGLPTGDRRVERGGDRSFAFVIVTDHWLLEPSEVQGFERPPEVDGLGHAELLIGVDHQPDARTDRLAHGAAPSDHLFGLPWPDACLHSSEPRGDEVRRFSLQFIDRGREP